MKVVIKIIALLFLMSFSTKAQWFWQNPIPSANIYQGVELLDENTIIIIGYNGTFLKTTNQGNSWYSNFINSDAMLIDLKFFTDGNGWLLDFRGKLFKTTNGGITFNNVFTGSSYSFAMHFLNMSIGWVGQSNGIINKTLDGGLTWQSYNSGKQINDIFFLDSLLGWASANNGLLLKTTNGGLSWSEKSLGYPISLNTITFVSEYVGWIKYSNPPLGDGILKSTDGGENWIIQYGTDESLAAIKFMDQNKGYALLHGVDTSSILKTTDGGESWIKYLIDSAEAGDLTDIDFLNENFGICVGFSGKIYKSENGGINWTNLRGGISAELLDILFTDEYNGFVCGYSGTLGFTLDGGDHWSFQKVFDINTINSIYFFDNTSGWLAGMRYYPINYKLLSTTNSGTTWINHNLDSCSQLKVVKFINHEYGWCLSPERIYRTTSGGNSWVPSTTIGSLLEDVFFVNSTKGWIVGWNGVIMATNDGGISWFPQNSGTTINLKAVEFLNENIGWVVGEQGKILKTTNGGLSWVSQNSGTNISLRGIRFLSSTIGWAIGSSGLILSSTNGGSHWQIYNSNTHNSLYSIFFVDENVGWIAGEDGTILKTTNGGVTFIEGENRIIEPSGFSLEQNYPNPFNPSTSIQFALSNPANGTGRQFVTLKVYDVLGREVATLVNEEKEPGIYRAEFNIQDYQLASGIYLYRLQAVNYVETKKMVLMK